MVQCELPVSKQLPRGTQSVDNATTDLTTLAKVLVQKVHLQREEIAVDQVRQALGPDLHSIQPLHVRGAPYRCESFEDPTVAHWFAAFRINKPFMPELRGKSFVIHGQEET
jgi:hypothetical protein